MMQNFRLYIYSLIMTFMLVLPVNAVVDDVLCSSADTGGTSCNATQLKNNGSEEFDAHSKRAPIYIDQTSGTDTIVATAASATAKPLVAYTNGQPFYLKPDNTITGPATLNIDTVGAIAIQSSAGSALGAGDLRSDTLYSLVYYSSGPAFRVLTSLGAGSAAGSNNYVTIGNTGALTNERDLTAGTAITVTDGGVNSTVTIAVTAAAIGTTQIGTDGVTADELNATGVEAELEAVMDLQDLQGAVIASQLTAIDTSAEIRSLLTDEIGTGVLFFLGAPASDDQAFVSTSSSAGAWGTLPDSDAATQKLQYDQTTNVFSAGTDDDIPDIGDFTNLALSGDVVSSALVTTIQADSVALTNDTTGNYAAGDAEAGAALTGDSATGFFSAGTIEDARIDGSAEADELVLAGDIDGTANANDIDEVAVETELESVLDIPQLQGEATAANLAADSVDTSEIAANAVGNSEMADNAIANAEMADNAIANAEMADNAIGIAELLDDAVGIDELDLTTGDVPVDGDCLTYDATTGGGTLKAITCPGSGGGIASVEQDTSPTLGGDLEGAGFDLGTAASQADDVFLAEGSIINWDNGDATLTQTGNSLAIGGATFTGASVDVATTTSAGVCTELATSAEAETGTDTVRCNTPAGLLAAISGKQTISIPAGAMISETTTGCAAGTVESATSFIMYKTMDCDGAGSLQEGMQFMVAMPKSSDEGTLTFRVDWTAASGSGDVLWLLSCAAYSNDDALATANFGTEVSVTDTVLTALDLHQSPESGAVTPGGTWAEGDDLWCRLQRDGDAAGDTLNSVDAKVIAVRALYTTNAFTDD